ncbi:MAG TPA: TrkA family potassium uptake protein [Spirochaetia bacterium]|nr:TrkA family potassium uptake protein [Spirochaetia bacterium]
MKESGVARENYVVIVGCGRLGAHLAELVSGRGSSVVVVDTNPDAFLALPSEFSGFTVEGDASEMGVLLQAKAGRADLFVAVTGSDNLNLMAAQIAGRLLGAKRALARVDEPSRVDAFVDIGIEVISPTTIMAGLFLTA